jgi:hypothetical protein
MEIYNYAYACINNYTSQDKMRKSHSKTIMVTNITNNKMTKYSSIKEAAL